VVPLLSPLEQLAAEWIWAWFDSLWELDQVLSEPFDRLREVVLPLLARIESTEGPRF
jgi:hypothetical protein